MRVIAGLAKGRRLKSPKGVDIRPITDMIKEALFNILGDEVMGASFLDLFAGTGGVGIEALSRGAAGAIFVDINVECIKVIKENLRHCGFEQQAEVYRNDVMRAIKVLYARGLTFDIIYADPPFKEPDLYSKLWNALNRYLIVKAEGKTIIRTPSSLPLPEKGERLALTGVRKYGDSVLYFYELKEGEEL